MTIQEVLRLGTIDALDRECLLGAVLKKDRAFLLAHPETRLTKRQVEKIQHLISEREQAKPLAYILGEKEFFGHSFLVNRSTLIPRPETELLVENVLNFISNFQPTSRTNKFLTSKKIAIVDVGTGSGNIIISLALTLRDSNFKLFGVDISPRALKVARNNARRHQVSKKITFLQSNLLQGIKKRLGSFDEIIILANLPYLSEKIYRSAQPTVRNFEPKSALVSSKAGLDHYQRLLRELTPLSQEKKVHFFLEISPEQAILFPQFFSNFKIKIYTIVPDLTGRSRLVTGTY